MTNAITPAEAQPARVRWHLVIVCALLSSAARFVPVPLLDDIIRTRIRQYLVSRLLKYNARTFGSGKVSPLWADMEGCASGCLTLAWKIPLSLILFPFRKIVAIVTALHGFSQDVTHTLLFGRALERALGRGLLAENTAAELLEAEANAIRRAFDLAIYGTDTRLVATALTDALRGVKGLPGAALRAARSVARSEQPRDLENAAAAPDREVVERGAGAVEQTLNRADVARVLADFDVRFDAALAQAVPPARTA